MNQTSAGEQARGRQEPISGVPQPQASSSSKLAWQFSYSSLDVIHNKYGSAVGGTVTFPYDCAMGSEKVYWPAFTHRMERRNAHCDKAPGMNRVRATVSRRMVLQLGDSWFQQYLRDLRAGDCLGLFFCSTLPRDYVYT